MQHESNIKVVTTIISLVIIGPWIISFYPATESFTV